eukprot:3850990-Amphidinium_carterae.1
MLTLPNRTSPRCILKIWEQTSGQPHTPRMRGHASAVDFCWSCWQAVVENKLNESLMLAKLELLLIVRPQVLNFDTR